MVAEGTAELFVLRVHVFDRVLRCDPERLQSFRVQPIERAPLSPKNVFQLLEPVVLEARTVVLFQIGDLVLDRQGFGIVVREQLITRLLLSHFREGKLVIDAFQQLQYLLLAHAWRFNQLAQEGGQPVLSAALASEVAHALQLAQVGRLEVRAPFRNGAPA